jgi:hypothetical protein
MKFVFCEGGDDLAIIKGLASSIGLNELSIEPFLGKARLRDFLRDVQKRPEFTTNMVTAVGIVRDADEDGDAAFQSVRDSLLANGFSAPNQSGEFASNGIKTGVLIVGPKEGKGMVEDLCLDSVSQCPEFPCVSHYFECIAQKSGRTSFSSKARIRVWMASQKDFDIYVGKAAEKGYWPWENAVFDPMRKFLQQL